MATIFDIAKKAGVSITTVSRALNGFSDVNENTRRKVLKIAEELNYYPNAAARSLQGKKTNTIAFAPNLGAGVEANSFLKEFMGMLALACLKHDLSLLVAATTSRSQLLELFRELAGSGRVDGLIVADVEPEDERINLLVKLGLPFIAFGRTRDYSSLNYPFIDVDGEAGIKEMVSHLYRQGHRRIAYISNPFVASCMFHRYEGYIKGMRENNLELSNDLICTDLDDEASLQKAIYEFLTRPVDQRPTAFVTSHDRLALTVMNTIKENGLEVGRAPGQIAVTGFDDLPFAAYLPTPLTTIRQPIATTCTVLLELLVNLLNKDGETPEMNVSGLTRVGPQQYLLKPEIISRETA
ncbi:MAG TPA: LacI family DNA-binding transcriptional regulator [Chloroflexia bacterium]|nr:LacI family DNA-binding transcriptional regulator [Chloroflexia bacterium]